MHRKNLYAQKEMNRRNEKIPYEKEMNKRNEKIPYEKEMNRRNEKILYENEMNKRNEKIPYEKEMNKRNEKIPDPQNCFGGSAIKQYPQIVWGGGGEGGGDPYTNQHPTLQTMLNIK